MNYDTFFPVQNPAGQRVLVSKSVDERAEPNSLHHAAHPYGARTGHLLRLDHAGATLPADLNDLVVFDQHRDVSQARGEITQARTSFPVEFHVVLDKVTALPFEPISHVLRMRAAHGTEQFKLGHGPEPQSTRG